MGLVTIQNSKHMLSWFSLWRELQKNDPASMFENMRIRPAILDNSSSMHTLEGMASFCGLQIQHREELFDHWHSHAIKL